MSKILIIGASGNIGGRVVSQLASKGARVRAMLRKPEAAALPREVEIVRGDLTIPESLDRCLDGVDMVFLVWVAPEEAAAPALARMAKQARRIVFLSAPLQTPHPFFQQSNASRARAERIERLIEEGGMAWTILRPGMFAGNSIGFWARQIRAGLPVRWPYLQTPTAPIDERDIAAVAVRALCEEGHSGLDYVLTGPESLTQFQQISTIGRAIGRTLTIEEMAPETAEAELETLIGPVARVLLDAWRAAAGQPAFVSNEFTEITGLAPRSFSEWAADHGAAFQDFDRAVSLR
ncbi:MAG TPA: NAD(P)H-binding protein [Candidatus Sulfopaludibacter sp.]|nr:NAD(P)H-binding protein [Candidatus Sulfopaludibacter sp.]